MNCGPWCHCLDKKYQTDGQKTKRADSLVRRQTQTHIPLTAIDLYYRITTSVPNIKRYVIVPTLITVTCTQLKKSKDYLGKALLKE